MSNIDVKKIREELNLTQQAFANRLGIDRRTVVNWERGNKIPESKIKLFELLLEGKNNIVNEGIVPVIKTENVILPSTDLTREIMELKDHIATLKNFLDEKSTISEFYKVENLKLKEEIEAMKNKE